MAQTIRLEYFGMGGEGPTVREAKRDAGEKVESLVRELQSPFFYSHAGYTLCVYRMVQGWGYHIATPDHEGEQWGGCNIGYGDKEEARRHGLVHLAQYMIGHTPRNGLEVLGGNAADQEEHTRYILWQKCARAWARAGKRDDELHALACSGKWPEGAFTNNPEGWE